jgi:hypothetical protein
MSDLSTQLTMGNADFNVVIEDQRNIVEINHEEPNIIQVVLPGVAASSRTNVTYGEGVPWEIEVNL